MRRPLLDPDIKEHEATHTVRGRVTMAFGAFAFAAFELSPWGRQHLGIQPSPVLVLTAIWLLMNQLPTVWIVRLPLASSVLFLSLLVQQMYCAVHGAASTLTLSPLYCASTAGAIYVSRFCRPTWLVVAVIAVAPPLTRLIGAPRHDVGLLVAVAVGFVNVLLYRVVAPIDESRRRLAAAAASERERVERLRSDPAFAASMALHDETAGSLLVIQSRLVATKSVAAVAQLARHLLAAVRVRCQSDKSQDASGLAAALVALGPDLGTGVSATIDPGFDALPEALRADLQAIAFEGVANGVRHGGEGTPIAVSLDLQRAEVVLKIRSSPSPNAPQREPTGRGLRNARIRALSWNGQADLDREEEGTTLTVRVRRSTARDFRGGEAVLALPVVGAIGLGWATGNWLGGLLAIFAIALLVVIVADARRQLAALTRRYEEVRVERLSTERAVVAATLASLSPDLTAVEATLQSGEAPSLAAAVDRLADRIGEIIAQLENQR